jgi:hypothetical protein
MEKIIKAFEEEFDSIHCVCFVMKASINKVTSKQNYIFQRFMELFGKDVAKNFVFIFTLGDSAEPTVLESVMDKKEGFG